MTSGRSGILVVDKAAGVTSADVVTAARRALGFRRVGHAGTLDPDAVGVLPMLIGEATKLMPYLVDQDKEYRVTVRFGMTTDTHDLGGRVLSTTSVSGFDQASVEHAATAFIGCIRQVPPMYSALHHGGKRLYELARAGIEVEREARKIVVRSIVVEEVAGSSATLRIVCGKGTYVRVLVADLGAALGVGAVVERLRRTRVGPFHRESAMPSEDLAAAGETLWTKVLPAFSALAGWPTLRLTPEAATSFLHGQSVAFECGAETRPGALVGVHDRTVFLGVGEVTAGGERVRPVRILHVDRPGPRVLPA